MNKKRIINLAFILGAVITLSVLLYPIVADHVNARNQSQVVAKYINDVAAMDDGERQALLEAAHAYNSRLLRRGDRFQYTEAGTAEYLKQLDAGRGVMGILAIDKINVKLSIYHGTDEGVLQIGLGHMQDTSLPVGGAGTHAFITGHRGLPSSTLLTELDKLAEGDTFVLYVMGETLTYRVDQILTVEPDETQALDIEPGKDYCTLVTCTPYGVNTHRLLVRGHRIPNAEVRTLVADAHRLDKLLVLPLLLLPVLLALLIFAVVKCIKISKGGTEKWPNGSRAYYL